MNCGQYCWQEYMFECGMSDTMSTGDGQLEDLWEVWPTKKTEASQEAFFYYSAGFMARALLEDQ